MRWKMIIANMRLLHRPNNYLIMHWQWVIYLCFVRGQVFDQVVWIAGQAQFSFLCPSMFWYCSCNPFRHHDTHMYLYIYKYCTCTWTCMSSQCLLINKWFLHIYIYVSIRSLTLRLLAITGELRPGSTNLHLKNNAHLNYFHFFF